MEFVARGSGTGFLFHANSTILSSHAGLELMYGSSGYSFSAQSFLSLYETCELKPLEVSV